MHDEDAVCCAWLDGGVVCASRLEACVAARLGPQGCRMCTTEAVWLLAGQGMHGGVEDVFGVCGGMLHCLWSREFAGQGRTEDIIEREVLCEQPGCHEPSSPDVCILANLCWSVGQHLWCHTGDVAQELACACKGW